MEDCGKPADSQEGSFPSTELTDRLLQRVEKPVGVIDTRPAEQIHARSAAWVAGKLDLLERYATRYGIVESVPQVTLTTLLRSGSTWPSESTAPVTSAEQPFTLGPEPRTASASSEISLPEQEEPRQDGPRSDSGEFKVRRNQGSVATPEMEGSVSKDVSQTSPQVKEIPGQRGSSQVNLRLRRNPVQRTSANAEKVAAGPLFPSAPSAKTMAAAQDAPRIKAENASPSTLEAKPLATDTRSLPLVGEGKPFATQPILQRKQARVPNPAALHVPEIVHGGMAGDASAQPAIQRAAEGPSPAQSTTSQPLVVRETYPARTPAQSASLISRNKVPDPAAIPVPETSRNSKAGGVSAQPAIQRADEGPRTAQSTSTPARSTTSPGLVVRETYPARTPAQLASLIFRNTDGRGPAPGIDGSQNRSLLFGSTRALAPPVLREPTNTLSSGSTELSVIGGAAEPSGGNGVDVAEVAEQVTRMIARQLAVDRERRGRVR